MSVMTLKPGLLVGLSTRLEGGVKYTRVDLDPEKTALEGGTVATWKTTREIEDSVAYDRAVKLRGKCGSLIRSACTKSAFGLLCPPSKENELNDAIEEARKLAETFNTEGNGIRISVYALMGRIAESDEKAARAIAGELREILDGMKEGIEQADVVKIRENASRAKKMGAMLDAETSRKLGKAVDESREIAKELTKKLTAKATDIAEYVQQVKITAVEEARFAFLDLDSESTNVAPARTEVMGLDLDEVEPEVKAAVEAAVEAEESERKVAGSGDAPELEL